MRQADLSVDATKLYKSHVELLQAWEHIVPLGPFVKLLLDSTNHLNEVFRHAERDLASPGDD